MKHFTNLLNNVKIASPCPANWDEMYGNDRQRFCAECKLNVYNLSNMTQREAENFLIKSEGRTCVKFYRRTDGSILTKDCPVGWQAYKTRISKRTAAFVSVIAGIFGGVFAFNQFRQTQQVPQKSQINDKNLMKVVEIKPNTPISGADNVEKDIPLPKNSVSDESAYPVVGMLVPFEKPDKRKRAFRKTHKN